MTQPPFRRDVEINQPGIVGARWWQDSLTTQVSRRKVLRGMLIGGGALTAIALVGTCGSAMFKSDPADDAKVEPRLSLEMQREFGWNFGAETESLTFNGVSTEPFDKTALVRMVKELTPSRADNLPGYVLTLFEAPPADRRTAPAGDPAPAVPLRDVLTPIYTAEMRAAYLRGQSLASLFVGRGNDVAVIVDLPGPESVAFAAGAADAFDIIFAIDNWPHPRAVVPAHLTLAAAAYYQPRLVQAKTKRPATAPPMYVLDRARLTPYKDEATQFDNRHSARIPTAARLKAAGVKRVLYVVPKDVFDTDLDDVNEPLVSYANAGIDVKLLGLDAFGIAPGPGGVGEAAYYGDSAQTHESFWVDYPWAKAKPGAAKGPARIGPLFSPKLRTTEFSQAAAVPAATPDSRPRPANFGYVPVMIATTGVILGSRYSRSGSWNRTSWGSGSGS